MNPFLSIVIPCYNSGDYLSKGLQSIVDCKLSELEVILADDCSTEDYSQIVDKFSSSLNIITCRTDHNSGNPSNGRELGASLASGTYLTFMDHDDMLDPKGINQFKDYAESHDYPEYVVTGIRQVGLEGNTEIEKFGILPFLHGKFFHRDKFYNKCNLHHKKDIKYQEDNYFTALVACNLIKYVIEPRFTDFCTYCWCNNPSSLGHKMFELKTSEEINKAMFNVNVDITEEVMFKYFDEGSLPYPVAVEWLVREVVSMYFDCMMYYQFIEGREPRLYRMIKGVENRLGVDADGLIELAFEDEGRIFNSEFENVVQFEHTEILPHVKFEDFVKKYTLQNNYFA